MTVLIDLNEDGAGVIGEPGARAAPQPRTPPNAGRGDARKTIVPVVKPLPPSVSDWEGGAYLSLQQWLDAPQAGGAILLQPSDDPRVLAGKLEHAALIAIDFPRIGDGRGYSQAVLVRRRLGYRGPLRAVGAVTADQADALVKVGFTSLGLRPDQDAEAALNALNAFSIAYQSSDKASGALSDRAGANLKARIRLLERALTGIASRHERAALASSLSAEDMVITDAIARLQLPIDIFTLDTGRLHAETLALIAETRARYGMEVKVFKPDETAVAAYVERFGRDGFYEGVAQRKACCRIRKVEPLARALEGRDAWITGQRREQSLTRSLLAEVEDDAERGMKKYNPLAEWSWADITAYADRFSVPMNALYARGYVSIGCEPCTKAVRPGEDPRNGRWWWENKESKECGLHTNATLTR